MENKLTIKKNICNLLSDLTDKQAGELIKGAAAYVFEDKPFQTKDEFLKGAFLYIKREIDVSKQNSANGKKGAEKRLENLRKKAAVGVIVGSVMMANTQRKNSTEK